jgi:ribosomal protein S18 acetylase RimI-like enzyme
VLTIRTISPSDAASVYQLLNNPDITGSSVLGERKHIALLEGEPGWVAEFGGDVVGLLQTAGAGGTFEVVADRSEVAHKLIAAKRLSFKGQLTAWSKDGMWDEVFAHEGFVLDRTLLKLSAPLPSETKGVSNLVFSGFRESLTDAWIDVNNDAFAGHNEQGAWTVEDFRSRQRLSWWDAAGLRIGMSGNEIAAFCWTKVVDAGLGEIYAIGVADRFQGLGYGMAMTSEGLRYLYEDRDCSTGQLYVDGANGRALRVYAKLGFEVSATDRSFTSGTAERLR